MHLYQRISPSDKGKYSDFMLKDIENNDVSSNLRTEKGSENNKLD